MEQEEMGKMRKILFYMLFGLSLTFLVFFLFKDKPISNSFTREYEVHEVEIGYLGKTIFLKQVIWGVSSDSKITAISFRPEKNIDFESENDFLYKSGATLFYKVKGDTLHVLSMEVADNPILFKSDLIIYQEKIENREFNELIKNYNEKGYLKFPK